MGLKQPFFARSGNISNNPCNPFCEFWAYHGTEAIQQQPMVMSGTIRNLKIQLTAAPGASASRTCTFRKNGSNQSLAVTISNTDVNGSDLSNSFTFVDGDLISCTWSSTGSPATSQARIVFEVEWADGSTSGYASAANASTNALSNSAATYAPVFNSGWTVSSGNGTFNLVGTAGTITAMRVKCAAPGAGKSRVFLINKNGTDQDGSGGTVDTRVTVSETDTTASATFSLSVAVGDLVRIVTTPSGTPASSSAQISTKFVASQAGKFQLSGSPNTNSGDTNYFFAVGGNDGFTGWNSTETNRDHLGPVTPIEFSGLVCSFLTAPGVGASVTLTLRKNAGDTGQAVTVSGNSQTTDGPVAGQKVTITTSDTFSMKGTRTSTPNITPRWAFIGLQESAGKGGKGGGGHGGGGGGNRFAPTGAALIIVGNPSVRM